MPVRGGTLANLPGYIETNGGTVIGMSTLTQSRDAAKIALILNFVDADSSVIG